MMDFLFFVKTFALTLVIVLVMQIQVGNKSIENHALGFVQSSTVVSPLNSVAAGGAKLIRDTTRAISASIRGRNNQTTKPKKEDGKSSFKWLWNKAQSEDESSDSSSN